MSELITIKTYGSRIEAEIDKGLLQSNSIKSLISADDCGGMRPHMAFTGGVSLMINEKDMDRAKDILKINNVKIFKNFS
jgi:hypothetical protein